MSDLTDQVAPRRLETMAILDQRRHEQIVFYRDALAHGELTEPGHTLNNAHCEVCLKQFKKGMRKFWYRQLMPRGRQSWWARFCDRCWREVNVAHPEPVTASGIEPEPIGSTLGGTHDEATANAKRSNE